MSDGWSQARMPEKQLFFTMMAYPASVYISCCMIRTDGFAMQYIALVVAVVITSAALHRLVAAELRSRDRKESASKAQQQLRSVHTCTM